VRQVLFHLPVIGLPIFGYGFMLFLAFLGSMNLAAWRARREKLDPELVYDLALWMFVGGLLGARTFYVWQYWGVRIHGVLDVFRIWEGGIVFYGSIMGGAVAFFTYWWLRPFPLRPTLDVVAPAIALGVALGRLGCFLNGCCYGDRCDLPWAVQFPPASPAWWDQATHHLLPGVGTATLDAIKRGSIPTGTPWSLPVHPTQIYSAIDGLIILLLLSAYYPLRRRDGEVMALLMMAYPITRFLIEYLRSDEGIFFAGMTISQNVSIATFLGGLLFWTWLRRRPERLFAEVEAEHERTPAAALA
jgi:phosphatidylglycerol:prolipoprotein diacylglycerol transferase